MEGSHSTEEDEEDSDDVEDEEEDDEEEELTHSEFVRSIPENWQEPKASQE